MSVVPGGKAALRAVLSYCTGPSHRPFSLCTVRGTWQHPARARLPDLGQKATGRPKRAVFVPIFARQRRERDAPSRPQETPPRSP